MKTSISIIFLTMFTFATSAFARESPRTQVETMFRAFRPGGVVLAVHAFGKGSLVPDETLDRIESQVRDAILPDETTAEFELFGQRDFGKSIKRLTYIYKTDKGPLVWIFWFYKKNSEWVPLRIELGNELFLN